MWLEIYHPQLVKDVREVFENFIFPIAEPRNKPLAQLKYIMIDDSENMLPLKKLTEKYGFLSDHLLIFQIVPGQNGAIHADGIHSNDKNLRGWKRHYGINIPIKNCNRECITEFFKIKEEDLFIDERTNTRWLRAGASAEKIDEYYLIDNPILINPQVPHKITNSPNGKLRVSVSWTVNPEWTWDQLILYFEKTNKYD
jgi:hypothetical protein